MWTFHRRCWKPGPAPFQKSSTVRLQRRMSMAMGCRISPFAARVRPRGPTEHSSSPPNACIQTSTMRRSRHVCCAKAFGSMVHFVILATTTITFCPLPTTRVCFARASSYPMSIANPVLPLHTLICSLPPALSVMVPFPPMDFLAYYHLQILAPRHPSLLLQDLPQEDLFS